MFWMTRYYISCWASSRMNVVIRWIFKPLYNWMIYINSAICDGVARVKETNMSVWSTMLLISKTKNASFHCCWFYTTLEPNTHTLTSNHIMDTNTQLRMHASIMLWTQSQMLNSCLFVCTHKKPNERNQIDRNEMNICVHKSHICLV